MPIVLLETAAHRITRDGTRIVFAKRGRSLVLGAALTALGAACFEGLRVLVLEAEGTAYADALRFASAVMLVCAAGLLVRAVVSALAPPMVLDAGTRTLRLGGITVDLAACNDVQVATRTLSGMELLTLNVKVRGRARALAEGVPGEHRQALEAIAHELASLARTAPLPRDEASEAAASRVMEQGFVAAVLVTLGVLWSVLGCLTMPNVVLTRHEAAFGLLAWPLGLVILASGGLETARAWLAARGRTIPRSASITVMTVAVVAYAVFAYRGGVSG